MTKETHPYTPPRPVGMLLYSEPYSDPEGSMFVYRNVFEIVAHKSVQCWQDWPGPLPVEVIQFRKQEACNE